MLSKTKEKTSSNNISKIVETIKTQYERSQEQVKYLCKKSDKCTFTIASDVPGVGLQHRQVLAACLQLLGTKS